MGVNRAGRWFYRRALRFMGRWLGFRCDKGFGGATIRRGRWRGYWLCAPATLKVVFDGGSWWFGGCRRHGGGLGFGQRVMVDSGFGRAGVVSGGSIEVVALGVDVVVVAGR